jgi:tetratricopeptide (TPR) repeat protein
MIRLVLPTPALVALLGVAAPAQPLRQREAVPDLAAPERIERLATWLAAAESHTPGAPDAAARMVAAWGRDELVPLALDAWALARLMRQLNAREFVVQPANSPYPVRLEYTDVQLRRLRELACVASGLAAGDACRQVDIGQSGDRALERLAAHARAARDAGDRSYVQRRCAMLHTDAATLGLASGLDPSARPPSERFLSSQDGQGNGVVDAPEHWDIARQVLDEVVPPGGHAPDPASDPMVRQWYVATISWLEGTFCHSVLHLRRAREIFSHEPEIEFLAGWQHEAFASAAVQEPRKQAVPSHGFVIPIGDARDEYRAAEKSFRRALEEDPAMAHARLRLGHVLLRLGRYEDAAAAVRQSLPDILDPALRYDALLFLGAAEAGLSHDALAEEAYRQASQLFPTAQSPLVGISELAWRRGRIEAANGSVHAPAGHAPLHT